MTTQSTQQAGKETPEIYKNDLRINRRLRQAERILNPINQLFKLMQEDGINPTIEGLQRFLIEGTDFIRAELTAEAAKAVKALKLKNQRVEESLIDGAVSILNVDYNRLRQRIHELQPDAGIEWGDVLILKNNAMLSESFKKRVEKEFTVTLNNDEKQEFWNELNNLCNSFNRLEELAREMGLPSLQDHLNPDWAVFFKIEEKGMYVKVTPDPAGFVNILEI